MITRLEVDGFKSFERLDIEFDPFTIVLGSNAAGKSNLFDVIQFLSNLADRDVNEAMKGLRGEPRELFRRTAADNGTRIEIAVEVLVQPEVTDPYGVRIELTHTRLRYELSLERREVRPGVDRVYVVKESVTHISATKDAWAKRLKPTHDASSQYLRYGKRKSPFLSTEEGKSGPEFSIAQDGKQGRVRPANAAEATVLYSITNAAEFRHLFALRQELISWRLLQLDPVLLRSRAPATAPEELEIDGSNLAAVLATMKQETATEEDPEGALADISAQLGSLVRDVANVDAEFDEARREYLIRLEMRDGVSFSSNVVSDGTLRILALLAVLHDPRSKGVICFEEPENGIHPARVRLLIDLLGSMVTDLFAAEPDHQRALEPLGQLVLNSHSPVVLAALLNADLASSIGRVLFADTVSVVDPESRSRRRKSRFRQVRYEGQVDAFEGEDSAPPFVSDREVLQVLETADMAA